DPLGLGTRPRNPGSPPSGGRSAPPGKEAGARSGRSPCLRGSGLANAAWAADVLSSYLAPLAPRTHAPALVGFPAATSSWPASDLGGAPTADPPPRAREPALGRSPDPGRVAQAGLPGFGDHNPMCSAPPPRAASSSPPGTHLVSVLEGVCRSDRGLRLPHRRHGP